MKAERLIRRMIHYIEKEMVGLNQGDCISVRQMVQEILALSWMCGSESGKKNMMSLGFQALVP